MPTPEDELLNKILDKALSLPADKREMYIKEACNSNAELLDKVTKLVAGCEADVPASFLSPSAVSARWIKDVYKKLKGRRG